MSKSQDDGALVVASLRFAAALLPPEVSPREICTKTALSAIVLASHRVSQQATAQLKLTPVADPRRLLTKLVESGFDDQLGRVAFADITWDSEGVASQTLEMELQDVEERAGATLQRSVCVLICARDGSSGAEETAVVWFPHRREDDNNSENKSHKYLLFVAPGRVKVIKSLSELMKKMHEEMPILRGREATYRAWTLLEGPKRKREAKSAAAIHPKTKDEPVAQHATPLANNLPEKTLLRQKEEVPEQEQALLKTAESHEHRRDPGRDQPLQRVPVRVVTEERSTKESMFAFSRAALVEPVEPQHNQRDDKRLENVASPAVDKVRSGPVGESVFEETTSQSSVRQPQRSGRVGVSASHATTASMRTSNGEGVEAAVWRSVDGEIKRTWKAAKDQIVHDSSHSTGNEKVASHSCPAVEENAVQDPVEATAKRPARVRPYVSEKEPTKTMFQFSSTRTAPSPPLTPASHVPGAMKPHQMESVVQRTSPVEEEDEFNANPELATQVEEAAPSPVKKKRSARDHYRSKLGARIWWELEYQATKILQQGVRTDNREDGLLFTNHASKKDAMQPQSATAVRCKIPHRAPDSDVQDHFVGSEATLPCSAAPVPVSRRQEPPQREILTEPQTTAKSASPVFEKNMIASCTPAPTRRAWDEPMKLVEKSPAKQLKLQDNAETHRSGLTVVKREAFVDEKKLVAPTEESGPAMINDGHCRSVDTRTSKIIEVMTNEEQSTPKKCTRDSVKANAPRAAVLPSPRKEVPASQVDLAFREKPSHIKQSKAFLEPPPQDTIRETLVRSQPPSSSVRFSARQSRVRDKNEEEDSDSVLMATMGPRTLPPSQSRSGVSRQPPPNETEPDKVEDPYADEAPPHRMPFNVHGRVPIRQPQHSANTVKQETSDRDDQDEDDEDQEIVFEPLSSPPRPAALQTKIHRNPPPMASFISVEPSSRGNTKTPSDEDATQRARQQKLTELRQKKLQQLQKARDNALNKKKPGAQQQQQSSVSHPVSTVVPEAKPGARSAAPPPTTSAMDRSEAFPLATTTTRTGHRPSNRQLIQNAIEYTLLAGGSLDKERQAALQALGESTCENFIVLLKSAKELKFRALYEHHMERGRIVKIYGVASSAPPLLTEDVISQFFRYNSGKKEFAPIDGRSFTVKTDACALVDQLVFKKKPLHRLL